LGVEIPRSKADHKIAGAEERAHASGKVLPPRQIENTVMAALERFHNERDVHPGDRGLERRIDISQNDYISKIEGSAELSAQIVRAREAMGLEDGHDPRGVPALADRLKISLDLFWQMGIVINEGDAVVDKHLEASFGQLKISQMGGHVRKRKPHGFAHDEGGEGIIDVVNAGSVEQFDACGVRPRQEI
jgi:hypothetical protein